MPAQIPTPNMPKWCFRPAYSKAECRGDATSIAAAVPATSAGGGYPSLQGLKNPQVTQVQEADNTIILGVCVNGQLRPSLLEVAVGTLPEGATSRDNAHNSFVSSFHKLIPGSDNPMYDIICEAVEVNDAEAILHNLGCAMAAARLGNQPAEATRLEAVINRFVNLVVYEIDLILEHLATGNRNAIFDKYPSIKMRGSGNADYVREERDRFQDIRRRIGQRPASANADHIMAKRQTYLLLEEEDRATFWEEPAQLKSIFTFFAFARGPLNIKASFQRSRAFWNFATKFFATFCDNGYRMVIGIERANERFGAEWASVFMRTAVKTAIKANRKEHQIRHHDYNEVYNAQMLLANTPELQVTDIDVLYVDRYTRNKNVLKRGSNAPSRPEQAANPLFARPAPAYRP